MPSGSGEITEGRQGSVLLGLLVWVCAVFGGLKSVSLMTSFASFDRVFFIVCSDESSVRPKIDPRWVMDKGDGN